MCTGHRGDRWHSRNHLDERYQRNAGNQSEVPGGAQLFVRRKRSAIRQQVPADVQALQAHQVISKQIEVAYGEVVHLPLQYGVDVAVCAQKHAAGEFMPDRSICKGY